MVKVSGVSSGAPARRAEKSKADSGSVDKGEFRRALAGAIDALDEAPALGAPSALGAVDALLLAQAVDEDAEGGTRKRLVNRGEEILDKLEELRHSLLIGAVPKDRLVTLAQQVRSRRESCNDPRLAALLDEIELRAEVEIAKLTRNAAA